MVCNSLHILRLRYTVPIRLPQPGICKAFHAHTDLSSILHIMNGIGQIIGKYLRHLECIRPYVDRCILRLGETYILLFQQDLVRCYDPPDLFHHIKTDDLQRLISEFQFIQIQEFHNKGIHLCRFIRDHITVKLPALRIIIDGILQSLGISLDQGKRSLQLMGHMGQEFRTHLLDPFLLLNILGKTCICGFQFGDGLLQFHGQFIHTVSQLPDLVLSILRSSDVKIQFCHAACGMRHLDNGPCKCA